MNKEQADQVLDPTILNAYSKSLMLKMLQIAIGCVSDNPIAKPVHLLLICGFSSANSLLYYLLKAMKVY
ncbi:hypothetical protein CUMW_198770 [Citrus unshiu]|nr:hypothetical protein CUMW_198770 [Citrus unshiu]